MDKAKQHAKNFIYNIAQKSRSIRSNIGDKDPLFTLCFDETFWSLVVKDFCG